MICFSMSYFRKIFYPYKLIDVFTPNKVAKLTYIKRKSIDEDIHNYLTLPGKQIVIYGHSGSGKTTLLRNKLSELKRNYIITHCESKTTFDELKLQAFDELDRFYLSEKSTDYNNTIKSEIKVDFANISSIIEEKTEFRQNRVVPIQLTTQKLAKFLGEVKAVWIIEDFHTISDEEKKKIADVIKVFADGANDYNDVKVVCLGAVGSARELIDLNSNLNNRVAELFVPLLKDEEIYSIIQKGKDLLKIEIEEDLIQKIVYYSNNLASVAHGLCYDICYQNEIKTENIITRKLKENSFYDAVNSFVRKNSDTFNKIYEKISSEGFGWYVLKTFESCEKEELTFEEIHSGIKLNKRPEKTSLFIYLQLLSSLEYKEIVRYNQHSRKYSISSPFFRTFLKMKMALVRSEQNETRRRKQNRQKNKYSIEKIDNKSILGEKSILYDENFDLYFKLLMKEIEIKRNFEEKKFTLKLTKSF